ncbi:MAG: methylenetetrahydrofolate reductase, partial [Synergistaceae bacterium]|nr:methylenetetrahydrofolate reductase [Synergistaceae bacterium]
LISQLFFDNDIFSAWKERVRDMGITQPIIAGIMPITSAAQISKVVEMCGASVPERVRRFVDSYGHHAGAVKEAGIAYATEQIVDLLARDVEGIHLYTMNQADTVRRIDAGIRSVLYTKRYEISHN